MKRFFPLLAVWLMLSSPCAVEAAVAEGLTSSQALKGLNAVGTAMTITEDVSRELKMTGTKAPALSDQLRKLIEQKLTPAGITVNQSKSGDAGAPVMSFIVDSDISTGDIEIALKLLDAVSPARDPSVRFGSATWSRKELPHSDEGGPIVTAATDLLDQFVAEYLAANPRTK